MKLFKCVLILALACGATACGSTTEGSGNIKTESRPVKDFDGIEVAGSAKLIVEQGDTERLSITADDNLLEYLTSEVEDEKLMLGPKGSMSLSPTAPIIYRLSVKRLKQLGVSGAVDVEARGIRTDSLTVAVSGSGNISISGEAPEQKIAVAGSADYKGENFATKDTSISISGSAKALVAVSDRLDVQVVGSGDVQYIGSPEVTQNITGAGSVKAWMP